jgi:hypothetical protein
VQELLSCSVGFLRTGGVTWFSRQLAREARCLRSLPYPTRLGLNAGTAVSQPHSASSCPVGQLYFSEGKTGGAQVVFTKTCQTTQIARNRDSRFDMLKARAEQDSASR